MERKDSKHTVAAAKHADLHPGREFVHALVLSQAAVVSSRQKLSATSRADAVRRFVGWALARLKESSIEYAGIEVGYGHDGDREVWLELPPSLREEFGGRARAGLRLDALTDIVPDDVDETVGGEVESVQPRAVLPWLIEQLVRSQVISHAVPLAQPVSVHELANDLFSAYQLDGGTMHLAGCTLEDRVILGLTYRYRVDKTEPVERDVVVFITPEGAMIDEETVDGLGLDDRRTIGQPPRVHPEEMIRLVEVIRRSGDRVRDRELHRDGHAVGDGTDLRRVSCELASGVFIWCKFAEGKIQFDFGDESTSVPFSGWARMVQPRPYSCPYSGSKSFYLAQTDDGRIVAADQIGVCQESGRRVLKQELVECAVTGRRVAADLAEICPITEQYVLPDKMVRCEECAQKVAPAALAEGICAACRNRQRVDVDDEQMSRVIASYPALAEWSDFRLAETRASYNLTARRRLQKLLLILDKQTLTPQYAAMGRRWSKSWQEVAVDELATMLG